MLSGDQRAQLAVWIFRRAYLQATNSLTQGLYQLRVNAFLGVNPAGGGAILASVVETKAANAVHHLLQIGVVEHQYRRLAAQFHMGTFNAGRGMGNDMFAGSD
ncbi:hypothetical protein D3C71_1751630 [compost metagenome]